MVSGDEATKDFFSMLTKPKARNIIAQFTKNIQEQDEYLQVVGSEQITGFQLMDIFDNHQHKDRILFEIARSVKENLLYKSGALKDQEDGFTDKKKEEEREKKLKVPDVNIQEQLKKLGYNGASYKKLTEAQVEEPKWFF